MSTPVQKLFDLSGKNALVTGGSRGLGLQIAESLGQAGARILLTSRKAGDLEEAAAHLQDLGIDTRWVAADMSQPAEIERVAVEAMQRLGDIDILVNNAGATWGAPAEDHPLEAWDKVMNLNIRSIFLMCQAIGKRSMIPRRQGRIINVASIAGLSGNMPGMTMAAYNTSKGAVVNFTRALAGEWGKYNINVNALVTTSTSKAPRCCSRHRPASTSPGKFWRSMAVSAPCTAVEWGRAGVQRSSRAWHEVQGSHSLC